MISNLSYIMVLLYKLVPLTILSSTCTLSLRLFINWSSSF